MEGLGGTGRLNQVSSRGSSKASPADDRPAVSAATSKKSKWQAQSNQLRAAMRAQKQISEAQARGEDIRTLKIDMGPEPEDDR
jgi:conjugal transfer/entry exclusion protein